jgi:hypothetical protein
VAEIPEEQQAEALRRVAEVAARRANAMAEVERITDELRDAAVHAARVGAGRSRIRELAKVNVNRLYTWWSEAGLDVRAKRPAMEKGE